MSRFSVLSVVLALALFTLPAVAVDGQIPIPNTAIYATPIVITAPGSYVVTRNLLPTGAGPVIDIAVPGTPGDVQLELNGHVLDNTPNPADPVIRVLVGAKSEVTIRDGSLIGGTAGIESVGPSQKLVVEDVKVSDFTGTGSAPAGIYMFDAESVVIRRSVVKNTTTACTAGGPGIGIFLDGGVPRQATIEDNLIHRTCDGIIVQAGTGVRVGNNRLLDIGPGFVGAGIHLDNNVACLVSRNTIHNVFGGPPGTGIRLRNSSGCKVYNNLVDSTSEFGIHIDPNSFGNLVLNNVSRGSSDDGIRIDGSGNHIERNTVTANGASGTGFGLHFTGGAFDNTYSRNTGSNNVGPAPLCAVVVTNEFCDDAFPPNGSLSDNFMPPSAPGGPI